MNSKLIFLIALFLTIFSLSLATRPDPTQTKPKPSKNNNNNGFPNGPFTGPNGPYGLPPGVEIPGFGPGWAGGYGSGYGGPNGGHSKNGVIRPNVVCKDKGPCYKKKLTCPAKCFSSYSHSGKNYGSGGGGGGCTMDCKKCVAYC